MTREEEIKEAAINDEETDSHATAFSFKRGARWADANPSEMW